MRCQYKHAYFASLTHYNDLILCVLIFYSVLVDLGPPYVYTWGGGGQAHLHPQITWVDFKKCKGIAQSYTCTHFEVIPLHVLAYINHGYQLCLASKCQ